MLKKKDKNTAPAEEEAAVDTAAEEKPAEETQNAENTAEETLEAEVVEENKTEEKPAAEGAEAESADAQPAEEADPQEAIIAEWRSALETAVKQRDEYLDSYRRSQADFQNFKRRNQTARSDGYEDGVRETIAALLPTIDNLERAVDAAEKAQDSSGLLDGVRMTLNMMTEALKKYGFEEIPALGEEFDPELHNAVMRESGDTPGKILEVFQKGYRVKGKIIRYAMVKVCAD